MHVGLVERRTPQMTRRRRARAPETTSAGAMRQLQRTLAKLVTRGPQEDVIRARAEALLSHLAAFPVAVLIANDRARYVDANRLASKLTGYSRAELTRMVLWDLTPIARRSLGARLWRDFIRRGHMSGRYELRTKSGRVVTADYLAVANVLPGVHVSALTPVQPRRPPRRAHAATASRSRKRRAK